MSETEAAGGSSASHERSEDQQKSSQTILEQEIETALEELERPPAGLLMSGLSAGLDIGFSVLAAAIIVTLAAGEVSQVAEHLLVAAAYSVGFVFVIFGRSELYTEHTTLAVLPVLSGQARIRQVLRLWGLVYVSNIVGTAVFAGLLVVIGPGLGVVSPSALIDPALHMIGHTPWVIFLSAIVAGWMMGLVSWLVTAARSTISEIFFVVLVTSLIGLADLHHCIVGSVKALTALFAGGPMTIGDYLRFLALATVGNAVGGVVFVAIIKYGHASRVRGRVFQGG